MSPSSERRPILVLQHAGCEPPGAYEDELLARRVAFTRVVLDEDQELPDWRAYAGIVAMGGAMSVNDEVGHPWLIAEKRLVSEAVGAGTPYWGVCLGAQLLAAALGARVSRGERAELGVLPVELTDAASQDPVFAGAPASFQTLQWHGETYELPPGAVQLARSLDYEQQAFVSGRAYALQFHLEVDSALAAQWMAVPAFADELRELHGEHAPSALLSEVAASERDTVGLARALFARWLERVVGLRRVAA
ncbi:MAG TPA: type 1 glutamine amidotransferase [Solirubrobacteraceae bacterium]|jgi:GMP synthase-like glutamine amidotransferase|nr:type 1 glutamine amidotransferase [Solirubrobacteraceae bacterium]